MTTARLFAVLLALAALAWSANLGEAAANPFTGQPAAAAADAAAGPGVLQRIAAFGLRLQSDINRAITRHMSAVRDGGSAATVALALALAFAYGMVHAAGPGHAKGVVFSYFLGEQARIGRGILMGVQIAAVHVAGALVIVLAARLVLDHVFGYRADEFRGIKLVSYAAILLVGLVMLYQAARGGLRHADGEACAHGAHRRQGALAFLAGLIPCTGAILVMLFAIANDLMLLGIAMIVAISAGMAVTMALIGVATILGRRGALDLTRGRASPIAAGLGTALGYAGPLAIVALGSTMLAVSV